MKNVVPVKLISKLLGKGNVPRLPNELAWLEGLSEARPLESLEAINAKLKPFALDDSYKPHDEWLHTLHWIARQSHSFAAINQSNYVLVGSLPPSLDSRSWEAVYYYHHFLAQAYLRWLTPWLRSVAPLEKEAEQVMSAVHAALGHLCTLVQWRQLRYERPPEGLWRKIHQVYLLGERLGLCRPDSATSDALKLKNEALLATYLCTLMLDTVSFTSMSRKQLDLAQRWLTAWIQGIVPETQYVPARHLYYVNLETDRGGQRIRPARFEESPSNRYWDIGQLMVTLHRAANVINEGGALAQKLIGTCSQNDSLSLLQYLIKEWAISAYQRQRRRHARGATAKQVSVCHGLQAIYALLRGLQSARSNLLTGTPEDKALSFEERIARHSLLDRNPAITAMAWHTGDVWTMRNVSDSGFGFSVSNAQASVLRLGMLISLVRKESGSEVIIGVIRNLAVAGRDEHLVGVEILFKNPVPVLAILMQGQSQSTEQEILEQELSGMAHVQFGLLLPGGPDKQDALPARLILPRTNYFAQGDYYLIQRDRRPIQVKLGSIIEQKDEWVEVNLLQAAKLPETSD